MPPICFCNRPPERADPTEAGVPSEADYGKHRPYFAKASKGILRLRGTTAKNGAGDGT